MSVEQPMITNMTTSITVLTVAGSAYDLREWKYEQKVESRYLPNEGTVPSQASGR